MASANDKSEDLRLLLAEKEHINAADEVQQ
jgi:hypothetical protein